VSSVTLRTFPDATRLAEAAASAFLTAMAGASGASSAQHVAVSGGRIARAFFETVALLSRDKGMEWNGTHFHWADERCVPPEHPESNYALAHESLFSRIHIQPDQVHRIRGEEPPEVAARQAAETLARWVPKNSQGQPSLDLVILGMGEDGHVASLFPGGLPPDQADPSYRAVVGPKPPPNRVTLTYPALLAANRVWVLASGAGKAEALRTSLTKGGTPPLGWVLANREETLVFSDIPGVEPSLEEGHASGAR